MSINRLNNTWKRRIMEIAPRLRKTQTRGLSWLIAGIYQSRSVKLSSVAGKIPGMTQLLSKVKRLSRLLCNKAINVKAIYNPLASKWLKSQAKASQQIKLIIDGTKVGYAHQLLMVSIAYRRRSIPISWTWIGHVKGHSSGEEQITFLREIKKLIPPGVAVLLVGDSEFGTTKVLDCMKEWRWDFTLRQKSNLLIWMKSSSKWIKLNEIKIKPGQSIWLENHYLTNTDFHLVSILIYWKKGETEPWYLATNLPDQKMTKAAYNRRMWIEEMFGDMKDNGFDLERTMLRHADRLSRLTLAVVLLYIWLVSIGGKTIKSGQRYLVDRKDRRDLSIFQIGLRFMERKLVNDLSFSIPLCVFY